MNNPKRIPANANRPCVLCGREKSCSAPDGGEGLYFCMTHGERIERDGWKIVGDDDQGFVHYVRPRTSEPRVTMTVHGVTIGHGAPNGNYTSPPKQSLPVYDWQTEANMAALRIESNPELIRKLAEHRDWPDDAFHGYPLGVRKFSPHHAEYVLPEYDGMGDVMGLAIWIVKPGQKIVKFMATHDGHAGGQRGLTYGDAGSSLNRPGVTFITEGAPDYFAIMAAGLSALGRANADHGLDQLTDYLETVPDDYEFCVVADNDPAGIKGAEELAKGLAERLRRSIGWTVAPPCTKADGMSGNDVDDWLTSPERDGADWLERGRLLNDLLLKSAKIIDPPKTPDPPPTAESKATVNEPGKASDPSSGPLPKLRSAAELVREFPQLRPSVIHGLLRQGETLNVIAPPKTGKSWLVLMLAMAVAAGKRWLGMAVAQGQVLIIDNELHEDTMASRIPTVAEALGILPSEYGDRLIVDNLRGRLTSLSGMGDYFAALEPGRFKIVVLDAWYRFMEKGVDENSNADMTAMYNLLAHPTSAYFARWIE